VADPDAAAAAYEAMLGAAPGAGRRFQLANTALVIRAFEDRAPAAHGNEPQAEQAAGAVVFGLGLAADDPAETAHRLERRGVPVAGGALSRTATHGVAITLAAHAPRAAPPARADAPHALDHVVIHTPDAERAVALYGGRLGLDLRLDRSNPKWGSRLLFFRCGGAVVEISADLDAPPAPGPDRITGLAWRVADPAAAQARLAAAGLDVSAVRPGRKPGTAVFTVRSGVPGAPALMLGGADEPDPPP
jgi:catechol 2,3-dioxygenase-like lactoylglutathione lyase family enzyme